MLNLRATAERIDAIARELAAATEVYAGRNHYDCDDSAYLSAQDQDKLGQIAASLMVTAASIRVVEMGYRREDD